MGRDVKVGIVGAGSVVEMYHLPVLRAGPGIVVEWLCDQSVDRARELAHRYGVQGAFSSLEQCPDVDIVLVAIPVGHRQEMVGSIVKRGWHIFCEKPFATSTEDHDALVSSARSHGLQIGVGLMRRFYDVSQSARKFLSGNPLGEVLEIWASEGARLRATGRDGGWYQTSPGAAGGGVLMETGSHLVDQLFFVLGVRGFSIDDCCQIASDGIDHETRVLGTLTTHQQTNVRFGLAVSRLNDLFNGIEVRCVNATLTFGLTSESQVEVRTHSGKTIAVIGRGRLGSGLVYRAFYDEWCQFVMQCMTGNPSEVDAETSRLSTEFIAQTYRKSWFVDVGSAEQEG